MSSLSDQLLDLMMLFESLQKNLLLKFAKTGCKASSHSIKRDSHYILDGIPVSKS